MKLSQAETEIINLLREINYGEISVRIRDKIPYLVSKLRTDIKLSESSRDGT